MKMLNPRGEPTQNTVATLKHVVGMGKGRQPLSQGKLWNRRYKESKNT